MAENTTAVYWGTGRRKEAVARVRLVPGTGKFIVNGRDALNYFGRQQLVDNALAPLRLTETADRFDVLANCDGGGINGQSGACRLGISRALLESAVLQALGLRGTTWTSGGLSIIRRAPFFYEAASTSRRQTRGANNEVLWH